MSDLITRAYAADVVKYEKTAEGDFMVYGIATGPKKDLDGQGCDPDWLRDAVPAFMKRGNIRLMHNPSLPPVGKAQKAVETDEREWALAIKVPPTTAGKDAQMMVENEMLTGISIGVKNAVVVKHPDFPNGLIKGGDIVEMSLVDFPAYQYSKLAQSTEELGLPVFKRVGSTIHYAGAVMEVESPAVKQLSKAAGALEIPAAVRARLERQRQDAEQMRQQGYGILQNPYAGAPQIVVPGKSAPAELKKAAAPAVVKHDDLASYAEPYLMTPRMNADGEVELEGEEAVHAKQINSILAGFKQLAIQEMEEDDFEFGCLEQLTDIARHFLNWAACEQIEGEQQAFMDEVEGAVVSLAAEPDRSKRHQMVKAIHTTLTKVGTLKEAAVPEDLDAEKAAKKTSDDGEAGEPGALGDGKTDDEEDEAAKAVVPDSDAEKVGKTISRATAARLASLAETPGVPEAVSIALRELAGFVPTPDAPGNGPTDDGVTAGDIQAAHANMPREVIPLEGAGGVQAAVSGSFVTPTGKAAAPDTEKAALVEQVSAAAAAAAMAALEKFVTSDAFVTKLASGVEAKQEATKAAEAAKVAESKAGDVEKAVGGVIEKMREEFRTELSAIKQLAQPAKGAISESAVVAAEERKFAANPDSAPAHKGAETDAANVGEAIYKRALAGDPMAQRIWREAVETATHGASSTDAAKAAVKAAPAMKVN